MKSRICIICEGYEEKEYFDRLGELKVFSNIYDFITVNAKSINNIFRRYQEKYQSNSYHLVLIFCDTDKISKSKYIELKDKINKFHGNIVSDKIIMFGNPSTMQIFLSHFKDIKLKSQSKHVNANYIDELLDIKNYDAKDAQRKEFFIKIKRNNYSLMKENIKKLSNNDEDVSSTNFLEFIEKFESDDISWINTINQVL